MPGRQKFSGGSGGQAQPASFRPGLQPGLRRHKIIGLRSVTSDGAANMMGPVAPKKAPLGKSAPRDFSSLRRSASGEGKRVIGCAGHTAFLTQFDQVRFHRFLCERLEARAQSSAAVKPNRQLRDAGGAFFQ